MPDQEGLGQRITDAGPAESLVNEDALKLGRGAMSASFVFGQNGARVSGGAAIGLSDAHEGGIIKYAHGETGIPLGSAGPEFARERSNLASEATDRLPSEGGWASLGGLRGG